MTKLKVSCVTLTATVLSWLVLNYNEEALSVMTIGRAVEVLK